MKIVLVSIGLLLATGVALAQASHYRSGYITRDGTLVAPSFATNPNATKLDNYSTKGNVNPYTGKAGTVDPYKIETPSYRPTYSAPKPLKLRGYGASLSLDD